MIKLNAAYALLWLRTICKHQDTVNTAVLAALVFFHPGLEWGVVGIMSHQSAAVGRLTC